MRNLLNSFSVFYCALLCLAGTGCMPFDPKDISELSSQCLGGQVKCGDTCVDPNTSSLHCGGCGLACANGSSCNQGRCETLEAQACNAKTKKPGMQMCGAYCADIQFSNSNCGSCSNACAEGSFCNFGRCVEQCGSPLKYCGVGCVNPSMDKDNCGSCGVKCAANERCKFGVCEK